MTSPVVIRVAAIAADKSHPMPRQMTRVSAGFDLYACLDKPLEIAPNQLELIGTGYAVSIPAGYEGQVRPRSGLALSHRIGILNSPGTIDADYRGEIKVLLYNFGDRPFRVKNQDRIAQLVVCAVPAVEIERVDQLDKTTRGAGGYGHTGR